MMFRSSMTAFAGAACLALNIMTCTTASAQQPAAAPPLELPPSALSPDNLAKPRPKAPLNITGNWFIDLGPGRSFTFGPPYPKFKPPAQKHVDAAEQARKEGRIYQDDIGKCFPAGMPMIMTRVWPVAAIQIPTAVYMISGFMNSLRIIYLDGRKHSDPDVVVRSFNGESIGRFEGDTLVVDTRHFETDHHWIDAGVPVSEDFRIVERMKLIEGGKYLQIEYTLIDPQHWEGEWKSTKRWRRVDDQDITEVECLPDLNEHLPSTQLQPKSVER
jgi:hypothetical protein